MPSISTKRRIGTKTTRDGESNTIDETLEEEEKEIPPCSKSEDKNVNTLHPFL